MKQREVSCKNRQTNMYVKEKEESERERGGINADMKNKNGLRERDSRRERQTDRYLVH